MAIYKLINISDKMATTRPFAYNPGWPSYTPISGTEQVQNLAIGTSNQDYSTNPGGATWWNGPDEDLGYVIAYSQPDGLHPTSITTNRLTLNSNYKGVDVLLSNGNQTAHQNFGYQQSVLGSTVISGTDKVMFTVLCQLDQPATLPGSHFIGIGYTSMNYQGNPYGGYPGNDNQSMGYCSDGTIHYNGGVYVGGLSTWTDGDIIDIALDCGSSNLWVRVNNGNWNNDPSHNPETNSGGFEPIGGPFYPALCPGFEGTMIIQNVPYQSNAVPSGFKFLGNTTASVGFKRSPAKTEGSFVALANETYNQSFSTGNDAKIWLNNNGYWTSYENGLILKLDVSNYESYTGTGNTWYDLSGNENDGAITNASYNAGPPKSFYFDGSGDFVSIGQPIPTGSNYSISAWVKANATSQSHNIVSSSNTPLWIASGTLYGGIAGNYTAVESASFPTGVWKFVTVTFNDQSNTMKLYINGSLVDSNTDVTQTYTAENMYIGSHYYSSTNVSFWNGNISQVYIYKNEQSGTDVLDLFNNTKSTFGI